MGVRDTHIHKHTYTSWPCGPDSRSLITAGQARLSAETRLELCTGRLLNMQQSEAFPLLTAAARVDNVIPVAPGMVGQLTG